MQFVTKAMLAQAINQLDVVFDAHDLEKRTLRVFTIEMAKEIAAFSHTSDPLRQFSAAFSQYVDKAFTSQIQKTGKVITENLGGRECANQQWRRVATTVSVTATGSASAVEVLP